MPVCKELLDLHTMYMCAVLCRAADAVKTSQKAFADIIAERIAQLFKCLRQWMCSWGPTLADDVTAAAVVVMLTTLMVVSVEQ